MNNEDYLWDRSGEPDAEIVRLEGLLGQLRQQQRKPNRTWLVFATAAAIVVASITGAFFWKKPELTDWSLVVQGRQAQGVRRGEVIETAAGERAMLESESVGEVSIEPQSKLRLAKSAKQEQRFALEHGTIHAFIWAPPTEFVVDTPAARATDLGCQYTLTVSPGGDGMLSVTLGWVAFESHGLESFIPAGARCRMDKRHGAGTPYRGDATPEFVAALGRFDATHEPAALDMLLRLARKEDALTLWHLLSRTQDGERAKVFAAFSAKVTLPPAVTAEAILRGDRSAFDAAWNALDLGDTTWWRTWKQAKPPDYR